jgi:acyl transferase domain-containing protein/3-hydroxymyristoyl/3-hydroxydecanoyl-(acyl carrier protein) dehydratase
MGFEPIAVVGQGCVLPGVFCPEELWATVLAGRDMIGPVPEGYWGVEPARVLVRPQEWSPDKIWSDRGGYVRGFDGIFDPAGFAVPASAILALDEQFHWVLHVAREALKHAAGDRGRAGLVLGNLAYPTFALGRYAASVWRAGDDPAPHPLNRFHAGMIAHFTASALELGAGAFALDAACASSLYAIKLACDRLHDRRADLMLAGAVNRCDDLLIRAGFCSLGALSRTGQSRPFHQAADGLVPAEGAALVALKRLSDAVADGDEIFGVIRGVGLSNDGHRGGLLTPSAAGQVRAMRQAYRQADVDPRKISLVECHATGTAVGDGVEAQSLRDVFADSTDLPIGSLKSNLGHLITAAGAAGLIKMLAALRAGVRPPTLHADPLREELLHRPLRVLHRAEDWPCDGPRRAAVSAFGFGGANAHLIVEEWQPAAKVVSRVVPSVERPAIVGPVAVVSLAVRAGGLGTNGFAERLFGGIGEAPARRIEEVVLDAQTVTFPPRDLERTLAQQLTVLDAALEAARGVRLPAESTGVYVGMQCDAEAARSAVRIRLAEKDGVSSEWSAADRDAFMPPLVAAGVVGAMPNIPANRINSQLGLGGPGFTVASEELSGVRALEIAVRALGAGEIDAAVVGAVDLCCEPVHTRAAAAVLPTRGEPGDAAVVLVLKRLEDARQDGDTVHALIDADDAGALASPVRLRLDDESPGLGRQFGHAHAASGLLLVAAGVLAVSRRLRPAVPNGGPCPWLLGPRHAEVFVSAHGAQSATVRVSEGAHEIARFAGCPYRESPEVNLYSGADRAAVLRALDRDERSDEGPARLALVAGDAAALAELKARARAALAPGAEVSDLGPGIAYRDRPIGGRVAFLGTSAATAYPGMGGGVLWAFPELMESVMAGAGEEVPEAARWWDLQASAAPVAVFDKLAGSMALTTAHGIFTREVLGIRPDVAMGLSSGEKDVLFAAGLCSRSHLGAHIRAVRESGLLTVEVGGRFAAAGRAWGLPAGEPVRWSMWRTMAPVERVREALAPEARAHLGIIHAPADVLIVGERAACVRVLERLGRPTALEITDYTLVFHAPELRQAETALRRSHRLLLVPQPGVSYLTAAGPDLPLTTENFLTTYTAQATGPVDFPRLVGRAWDAGVRVFIEHGAHNLSSRWVGQTLQDREHLAVALDIRGNNSLLPIAEAIAQLLVAGVRLDYRAFNTRMRLIRDGRPAPTPPPKHPLRFPAHLPPVVLPAVEAPPVLPAPRPRAEIVPQRMEPAPMLARAFEGTAAFTPPSVVQPARAMVDFTFGDAGGARTEAGPSAGLVLTVRQAVQAQSRVFRNYLENQHRTHNTFLDFRSSVGQLLAPQASEFHSEAPHDRSTPASDAVSLLPLAPVAPGPAPLVMTPPLPSVARSAPASVHLFPLVAPAPCVSVVARTNEPAEPAPRGPSFSQEQLLVLASGKVSSVFGPLFEQQDGYARQVRLPTPPLLLVDRITGIDAEPGVHGRGTIWTETDIRWDSWHLHHGVMPAGIMIEAGQADLTLISWMGADFQNRGERVYRLLGCDLTYHRGLPRAGETLRFDIHIDGHAKRGNVRLFFFHYDGRIGGERAISVRNGQAGFFTDQELKESGGVLWSAETGEHSTTARLDPPRVAPTGSVFGPDQLTAYYDGRLAECFGRGYELLHTHTRSPLGGKPALRLVDEVTHCDARGGPWGRGYLRARTKLSPRDWFFNGHFHNDPCMPGTLMCEGTLQAMAFYLTWLGYTLDKDGWRFEPVPEETYKLRCRGQIVPESGELICELFVEEVHDGPQPVLYADLLGTVDGLKAFHCRRMGVRLVPDWPLSNRPELLAASADARPFAVAGGVRGDYPALLACAWGRPSDAFGSIYQAFDGHRRGPRLPGPPYHFMSRITRMDAEAQTPRVGATIECEYDVPVDDWYFRNHGARSMPFSVLMEVNLQPCGWLACFLGFASRTGEDLYLRNLDGSGAVDVEVPPGAGTLRTRVTLTSFSTFGGIVLVSFDTACRLGDGPVCRLATSFGLFTGDALAKQAGLPTTPAERAVLEAPCAFRADLTQRPARYFGGPLRLANGPLLMIDRVTGYWPDGGTAGLGRLRSEQSVDPSAWYFKAHFYQDPVQPGSLGIEAMLQLLQFYVLERNLHEGISHPLFEPIASGRPIGWKYRGQVVPGNGRVRIELEVVEVGRDEHGVVVVADAWLWVDELRIYHARGLAVRVRSGENAIPNRPDRAIGVGHAPGGSYHGRVIDG